MITIIPASRHYVANTAEQIGELIRKRRRELGLTQKDLYTKYNFCSKNFISQVERGKKTAEIGRVLDLMLVLDLHLTVHVEDDANAEKFPV